MGINHYQKYLSDTICIFVIHWLFFFFFESSRLFRSNLYVK